MESSNLVASTEYRISSFQKSQNSFIIAAVFEYVRNNSAGVSTRVEAVTLIFGYALFRARLKERSPSPTVKIR